jgi:hypothetical protein
VLTRQPRRFGATPRVGGFVVGGFSVFLITVNVGYFRLFLMLPVVLCIFVLQAWVGETCAGFPAPARFTTATTKQEVFLYIKRNTFLFI